MRLDKLVIMMAKFNEVPMDKNNNASMPAPNMKAAHQFAEVPVDQTNGPKMPAVTM